MNSQTTFKATKQAVRNIFSPAATQKFPVVIINPPEGYRGSPKLNAPLCTLCMKCSRICPTCAIEITKIDETNSSFEIDLGKCCYCGECEDTCAFDAIILSEEWLTAGFTHDEIRTIQTVEKSKKKTKENQVE